MTASFTMNSFEGKRVLALVRDGDFAHAGEEEAIDVAMKGVPKDPHRRVVDAGCGRGGTAAYLQRNGWGKVTGFDIEPQSIAHAQKAYPDVAFVTCDAVAADQRLEPGFRLVTLFNVLHALPRQADALRSLARLADRDGRLIVFDYVDHGDYQDAPVMEGDAPFLPRPPMHAELGGFLAAGGWQLEGLMDIDGEYERWYADLVSRIEAKRTAIERLAGAAGYAHVHDLYSSVLAAIRDGRMGGAVIVAARAD